MNKNPREWPVWDNEFFGLMNTPDVWDEFGWILFLQAITTVFGGILGMMIVGLPLELVFGVTAPGSIIAGLVSGIAFAHMTIRMGKFYKGHSMPIDKYPHRYNFKHRAEEYFSLPPEDRSLYPRDIIKIVRDPDLTRTQLSELDNSMRSIYNSIQERERQKRLLSKRNIDIDGIVEYMKDSKRGVDIDINTYRELG